MSSRPALALLGALASLAACGPAPRPPAIASPWAEHPEVWRVRAPIEDAARRGATEPLVTIITYSDFECPYCAEMVPVLERVLARYPDSVELRFRHNPMPMHEHAALAAEAAEEARAQGGDEAFWRMHDLLFANQEALSPQDILRYSRQIGVDLERMNVALRGRVHRERVQADAEDALRLGADGTPAFFINGRLLLGAYPFEDVARIVDEEIALAREALRRGVPRRELYAKVLESAHDEPMPAEASEDDPDVERELDVSRVYRVPVDGAPRLGPEGALATLIVFSDFECPYCAGAVPTLQALRGRYGSDLRIVFRHLPLPMHRNAFPAALAAIEAREQRGDEAFWAMHDRLFASGGELSREALIEHARALGLDVARFTRAIDDETHAPIVERDLRLARQFGAQGTPTFFVNGRPVLGAEPLEQFASIVDDAIERARQAVARGAAASPYDAVTADGASEAVWITRERGRAHVEVAEHAPRRGAASPRLIVQVWSDFECPYCGDVAPTLARLVAQTPGLQLVFRHLPLPRHERALPAALAAIEVRRQLGDEGFWRFHDRLFAHQDELADDELAAHAAAIGADAARVTAAIEGREGMAVVRADVEAIVGAAEQLGTPAILVGDRLLFGALPLEEFQRAVAGELERAGAATAR